MPPTRGPISHAVILATRIVTALAVIASIGGCSSHQPGNSGTHAGTPQSPQARLDGLYHLVSGKTVLSSETWQQGALDQQWAFRSACSDVCIATAKLVSASNDDQVRVLDYVDGHWTRTVEQAKQASCDLNGQHFDTTMWVRWSVQLQTDGTLTGTIANIGTDACQYIQEFAVTLTRIGDAPANANLPDPATQPKPRSSVAQGLRGKYLQTAAVRGREFDTATQNWQATTSCVRGGDRCVTYLVAAPVPENGPVGLASYTFGDGKWTQSGVPVSQECGPGVRNITFSPPAPPVHAPIAAVVGEGRIDYSGSCPPHAVEDYQLQHVGD
jgi:hypothetical protein